MSKIKRVDEIGINQHPNASVYSSLFLQCLPLSCIYTSSSTWQIRLLTTAVVSSALCSTTARDQMTDSGMDGRDEKNGTRTSLSILHPIDSAGGSTGRCLSACSHTDAW